MNTINLNSIVLHRKSSTFGRVSRLDSMGNLSFATMPYRGVPQQKDATTSDCIYIGEVWQDAWGKLAEYGLNDPRIPGYVPPKAPVVVSVGAYEATVEFRTNGFVHITNKFLGAYASLVNSFRDPDEALALGRALVMACRPEKPYVNYIGWDWHLGEVINTGWLLLKYEQIPLLPDTLTLKSGYEMGESLVQLGEIMQINNNLIKWLGERYTIDIQKAG